MFRGCKKARKLPFFHTSKKGRRLIHFSHPHCCSQFRRGPVTLVYQRKSHHICAASSLTSQWPSSNHDSSLRMRQHRTHPQSCSDLSIRKLTTNPCSYSSSINGIAHLLCRYPRRKCSSKPPSENTEDNGHSDSDSESSKSSSSNMNPNSKLKLEDSTMPPIEQRPAWVLISEEDARDNFDLDSEDLDNMHSVRKPDPYDETHLTRWFYLRDAWEASRRKYGARFSDSQREVHFPDHKQHPNTTAAGLNYEAVYGWRKSESLGPVPGVFPLFLRPPNGVFGVEGGHIVRRALMANLTKLGLLSGFYWYTSSVTVYAEVLHGFADVGNQAMLLFSLHLGSKHADWTHPYGYSGGRWGFSCLSGAFMSLMGVGAIYEAIVGAMFPTEPVHVWSAMVLLATNAALESYSFLPAWKEIRNHAQKQKRDVWNYLKYGTDSTTIHVFAEDSVGFTCSTLALISLSLTNFLSDETSVMFDVLGGTAIGATLTGVGGWLCWRNMRLIMGRSLPPSVIDSVLFELEKNEIVASYHDVKSMIVGVNSCVVKCEVNLNADLIASKHINTEHMYREFLNVQRQSNEDEIEYHPRPMERTCKNEAFHDLIMKSCAEYQSWMSHERSELESAIREAVKKTGGFEVVHVDIENF